MNLRTKWFLNSNEPAAKSDDDLCTSSMYGNQYSNQKSSGLGTSSYYSNKDGNGTRSIIRKTSKEKRIVRRSSSKKDKENGNQLGTQTTSQQQTSTPRTFGILSIDSTPLSKNDDKPGSLYKPRL